METLLQKCIVFTTCSFKLRRFCRQGSLSWSSSWWDEQGRTLGVTCENMRKANGLGSIPIGSMYDVFTYIWMISMVNVKVNLPYMHPMGYDVQISCCETSLFLEKTYHGTRIVRLSSLVNCQKGKWFLKKIWSIFSFVFLEFVLSCFCQLEIRYLDKHQHVFSSC